MSSDFYRPSGRNLRRADLGGLRDRLREVQSRRPWRRLNFWPFLPWILSALMWWGIIKGTPALVRWLLP